MSTRLRALDSSVATKLLMGVTGLALFLFLISHIIGNSLILFGPTTFNAYAHMLTSNPLVPVIELGLLLIFLVHIVKAVKMFGANKQARPVPYERKEPAGGPSRKTMASSTMILSGFWLLLFVVLHVKGFKYGAEYEGPGGVRDLYRLVMENFGNPLVVVFYVVSMLVIGSHLWHGVSSAFQSLGVSHKSWTPRLLYAGRVAAVVISGGFVVIAVWAYLFGGRS